MKPITKIEQIIKLANQGKSVIFNPRNGNGYRIAAAFIQNYQARMLFQQIKAGYYFFYTKGDTFKCCLCGKQKVGGKNNPQPLKEGFESCCDNCNRTKVIPERIKRLNKK